MQLVLAPYAAFAGFTVSAAIVSDGSDSRYII
jgi:hypothetical protein